MITIDINCDLGESFGAYVIGNDKEVLKYVSSVNVACGFHAGDPMVMEETVHNALENNVAIGAHPGYPDLMGFGRRPMTISLDEVKAYITYQIGALDGFINKLGGKMQHVKPHGALYNMASSDRMLATAIAEAVYSIDKDLILFGLAGSELIKAGQKVGLQTASEVFADRTYTAEGVLASRSISGSMIENIDQAIGQVVQIIQQGTVNTIDGGTVNVQADTVCVHGDSKQAVELLRRMNDRLNKLGINICALKNRYVNG